MFSNINKPAFGTATPGTSFGFGSNASANQTPFGQPQLFGKTGTSSGFGSTAPLFGSTSQQSGTPLFSNSSVPSFGSAPQQSGFGTALFGQQQNVGGGNGLFSNTGMSTFGQQNKPTGFGFGGPTSTALFGQQQTQNFQQSSAPGVFGSGNAFGSATQMGTVIKFNPVTGTDTMQKSGITHSISTKHHCITCMKEYEAKSLEELRWEDYQCNRRGPQQQTGFNSSPFGVPASNSQTLFGQPDNKPAFGQPSTFGPSTSGFGMGNQSNQQTLFGKPAGGFGAPATTSSFGFNTATPTFGSGTGIKPFGSQPGQNIFGTSTTQATGFGNTFFGQPNNQNSGSFFNKPAQSTFNTQPPVFSFGQQPTTQNSFFQTPKSTTGFGTFGQPSLTTNTGFGQQPSLFSQAPQNPFNAFQKPAQHNFGQPLQGFAVAPMTTSNFFGVNKPLFPATSQISFFTPPTGGGFMMPQQQPVAQNPVAGFESQQQDFHSIVVNVYEPFPHHEFLADIQTKRDAMPDTTNPKALKEIIDNVTAPIMTADNISKMRIISKPKYSGHYSDQKLSFLADVVDNRTRDLNYLLKSNSGKRLSINPEISRADSVSLEEEKVRSPFTRYKNLNRFHNERAIGSSSTPFSFGKATWKKDALFKKSLEGAASPINEDSIQNFFSAKEFKKTPLSDTLIEDDSTLFDPSESTIPKISLTSSPQKEIEQTKPTTKSPIPATTSDLYPTVVFSSDESKINEEQQNTASSVQISSASNPHSSPSGDSAAKSSIPSLINDEKIIGDAQNSNKENLDTDASIGSKNTSRKTVRFEDIFFEDGSNGGGDNEILNTNESPENINSCGIILKREGYYTIPPLCEMDKYRTKNGACVVKGFTIGRRGYGSIYFMDEVDISNLNLDEIVHIRFRGVSVYPNKDKKPPVGQGLNKPAQITLDHVWPRHCLTGELIKDPRELSDTLFRDRLVIMAERRDATFLDYRPETGSWVFLVKHFSSYSFDEIEDMEIQSMMSHSHQQHRYAPKPGDRQRLAKALFEMTYTDSSKKGLGGIVTDNEENQSSPKQQSSLKSSIVEIPSTSTIKEDDSKNVILMKTAFFEEDSISDDVSSSEVDTGPSIPTSTVDVTTSQMSIDSQTKIQMIPSKTCVILNQCRFVPIGRSLLTSNSYTDIGIFKGRSFKVGWGQGYTLTSLISSGMNDLGILNGTDQEIKPNRLACIKISTTEDTMINLVDHLKIVLLRTIIKLDAHGIPFCTVKKGWNCLIEQQGIEGNPIELKQIWDLCMALWGPDAAVASFTSETFGKWLEEATAPLVKEALDVASENKPAALKNIFTYLSGHQVNNALELSMKEHLPRLSVLLSEIGANGNIMADIYNQLGEWENSGVTNYIDPNLLKIYMLLGGMPVLSGINVCEDIDWLRALALHFWYMCPQGVSITEGIRTFRDACGQNGYAHKPIPPHRADTSVNHVLYNLMMLFVTRKLPLNAVCDPASHSENPLDYRMSWLLLHSLLSVEVGTISQQLFDYLSMNFSAQLENLGLWEWAIFILMWIKDPLAKTNAILDILCKNLNPERSPENLDKESFLVTEFNLPPAWIHFVLAHKTILSQNYVHSFKHLTLVDDYAEAHKIAINHIIPNIMVDQDREYVKKLLEHLAPHRNLISDWDIEGGLILDYLDAQDAMYGMKTQRARYHIRELKAKINSLCYRSVDFPTNTLKQHFTISELGKHIGLLLKMLYYEFQPCNSVTIKEAVTHLHMLNMPPDYKHSDMLDFYLYFIVRDK